MSFEVVLVLIFKVVIFFIKEDRYILIIFLFLYDFVNCFLLCMGKIGNLVVIF